MGIVSQMGRHSVAIVSLLVALCGLGKESEAVDAIEAAIDDLRINVVSVVESLD